MGRFYSMILDEDGQGFVEYGFLIAFIALAAIVVLRLFGTQVESMYNNITLHEALDLNGANR